MIQLSTIRKLSSKESMMEPLRSSHRRCFVRKGVLRNLGKFTEKYLCQRLFFNKVAGLKPATLLKNRFWHRCCEFCEISKNTFFTEHLRATASVCEKSCSQKLCNIHRNAPVLGSLFDKRKRVSNTGAFLRILRNF